MNYNISKLKSQLQRHEGLRLKPYKDSVGVLTVGYGRNLEEIEITEIQANEWLLDDVFSAEEELEAAYPWVNNLSEKRQRVLVNMSFNLGLTKLMKFKKMWAALEKGDMNDAAEEMLNSKWANQVGKRAEELAKMMRDK